MRNVRAEVVHHAIELVALQPAARFTPDLAANVRLGVLLLHNLAEGAPKIVVINLMRHIKSPAIHPKPNPVLRHLKQILADGRVLGVELRQIG